MDSKQITLHKCPIYHTNMSFRKPESRPCDWTKLLTFLDLYFINSKMNRLNHKISPFSSALTFIDSNRKNQPFWYHVMQLKRNKSHPPHPFFPFLYFYSKISFPPHDCYRKSYWKREPLLYLNTLSEISATMSCMEKIQT